MHPAERRPLIRPLIALIERVVDRDHDSISASRAPANGGRECSPRYRVHDYLPILVMDHLARRTCRDIRATERVAGMLVNVVATCTMFLGERLENID